MNLLFLDQFSDIGGAQLCLLDLLRPMGARGWRAVVAAPGDGDLFERARASGAAAVEQLSAGLYSRGRKTTRDFARFLADFPRARREIRRLLDLHGIDLVYVNGPRLVPAAASAAGRRFPIVYHCHSYVPRPYGYWLVGRPLEAVRATVISSSRYTARSLGYSKVHVVYNGVADCARPRASAASTFRIGAIGRIAPQKGQLEFVRAAQFLTKGGYRFEVCGAASPSDPASIRYEQEVRRAAQGLPVQFTGWTDDIASVLARLDVLVVPSIAPEATTRVILEAFSAGVAVVAFSVGGISEVVSHNRTGILVDEITPNALARAINELMSSDQAQVRAMTLAARKEWESRYTLARYQRDVVDIVEAAFTRLKTE